MASGDRTRIWFTELQDRLRREWRAGMSWDELIRLRDRLQTQLESIRAQRKIAPPVFRCPTCKTSASAAPSTVSVRAMILVLGKFGIASEEETSELERGWINHQKRSKLDRHGKPRVPRAIALVLVCPAHADEHDA